MNTGNISKRFIIPLSFILIAGSLSAQPRLDRQGPPLLPSVAELNKMVDEMAITLKLSKSQEAQISKLYTAHFDEVRAHMESARKAQDSDRDRMEVLRYEFETQVKSVLTKSQIKGFEDFENNHRPPKHGQRPPRK